jgi:hypothetical protein
MLRRTKNTAVLCHQKKHLKFETNLTYVRTNILTGVCEVWRVNFRNTTMQYIAWLPLYCSALINKYSIINLFTFFPCVTVERRKLFSDKFPTWKYNNRCRCKANTEKKKQHAKFIVNKHRAVVKYFTVQFTQCCFISTHALTYRRNNLTRNCNHPRACTF